MNDKWLDEIKDRVSDFEMETPDGLWDSIEKEMALAVPSVADSVPVKKSLWANWKKIAAFAAAIALILGVCLTFYFASDEATVNLAQISTEIAVSNQIIEKDSPEIHSTENPGPLLAKSRAEFAKESSGKYSDVGEDFNDDSAGLVDIPESDVSGTDMEKGKETIVSIPSDEADIHDEGEVIHDEGEVLTVWKNKTAYSDFSVGASASASGIVGAIPGGSGANDNFGSGLGHGYGSGSPNGVDTRMGGLKLDGFDLPSVPSHAVFEHKLPVRVGLDVSWRINRYLALQTGLSYTYLKSDISYGGTYSYSHATQQLHYVGIPISIRYIPFQWKNFNAYISVGLAMEKCVAGKLSSDSPFGVQFQYDGMNERPFQFSANAAFGIQYDITKVCGVFVEPGMSYYFDDGASLRTIYKDHPVNFNINIGLRFSLPKKLEN
ncbi:MAG: PorT family protein [Muribaculum sp.]|nr:PorT family protein [Muribaculum sp.]